MGHRDLVSSFSFCPHPGQSHICVSSASDGSVCFWDSAGRVLLREHAAHQVRAHRRFSTHRSQTPDLSLTRSAAFPLSRGETAQISVTVHRCRFCLVCRLLWQQSTGLLWTATWWCRAMRRELWCVTGSTPETRPAASPSLVPSSACPAPLTPGALWLWGKKELVDTVFFVQPENDRRCHCDSGTKTG